MYLQIPDSNPQPSNYTSNILAIEQPGLPKGQFTSLQKDVKANMIKAESILIMLHLESKLQTVDTY